jgi:saccharopine dehydrogenase (NAD+, L-lysine forming)
MVTIRMRHEVRANECRAPIVPADAARLVEHGITVTVERSARRVFPISDYAEAGCVIADEGSWVDAPGDEYVVGLKALPEGPFALRHRHVFFGHAYKGQPDGRRLLRRFAAGGGALLDLEYLVDDDGRRVAAFGYLAGYVGAALAVQHDRGQLTWPLRPMVKELFDDALPPPAGAPQPRALVIGALGRCGRGACDALRTAGIEPTLWDVAETRSLDAEALLDHDILINAVLVTRPVPPFLTRAMLRRNKRLRVVADVACDVGSEMNVLPVYDSATSWEAPVRRLEEGGWPVDLIAIDNLPSMLPRESSITFSAELTPHLMSLGESPVWRRSLRAFRAASESLEGKPEHDT